MDLLKRLQMDLLFPEVAEETHLYEEIKGYRDLMVNLPIK